MQVTCIQPERPRISPCYSNRTIGSPPSPPTVATAAMPETSIGEALLWPPPPPPPSLAPSDTVEQQVFLPPRLINDQDQPEPTSSDTSTDASVPSNYIRCLWKGPTSRQSASSNSPSETYHSTHPPKNVGGCSMDGDIMVNEPPPTTSVENSEDPILEDFGWRRSSTISLSQPPVYFEKCKKEVLSGFVGKKLYLFLDYDGTLTPIVRNPWDARLSPNVRELLYKLAGQSKNLVTVGIVTGRALSSVKNFVQIQATEQLNFIYAASHGFHIEAAGRMLHHKVGSRYIPALKQAAKEVAIVMNSIPGITLEDNEFSFSVHYRNAPEDAEAKVERLLDDVLKKYDVLKKTRGKKVFELRINVTWDKGRAVSWLLHTMRVDPNESETRVIYIGDDLTDEDAFHTVRQFDNSLTILVSDHPSSRPTAATYFLEDPGKVADLLKDILEVAQQRPFDEA